MNNNFPKFVNIDKFNEKQDLYICALGFEDRSLGSNKDLLSSNFKTKTTLIIEYDTHIEYNERDKYKLEKIWTSFSDTFISEKYSHKNRHDSISKIQQQINDLEHNTVTLNISSFKTHLQLELIDFLLNITNKLMIIYTEPKKYGNQTIVHNTISSGIDEIFTTGKFSGALLPGYSSILITFLGHDFTRTNAMYDEIQPTKKISILPKNVDASEEHERIKEQHLELLNSSDVLKEFSIFDLDNLLTYLTNIREEYIETSNISIALNGSKLHSLVATIFAKKFLDIQLIMSTPTTYHPNNYSFGVGNTYKIDITRDWFTEYLEQI